MSYCLLQLANQANNKDTEIPKQPFRWLEEHQNAFDNIKNAILQHTKTTFPDFQKQFYATTDASKHAIGGFLYQKDDEGTIQPTAAISRVFTKTEQNYNT